MVELCPACGTTFAAPAELLAHVKKTHRWASPEESLSMNPSSHSAGVTCALCGRTFTNRDRLAAHSLGPHVTSWLRGRPSLA